MPRYPWSNEVVVEKNLYKRGKVFYSTILFYWLSSLSLVAMSVLTRVSTPGTGIANTKID